MNDYYNNIKNFQDKVLKYTKEIFKVYENELKLRIEDYNHIQNIIF